MDTDALFREIEGIDIERKRLREQLKKLNNKRVDYINRLIDAAESKGADSLVYKDKEYPIKQKVVHARKAEKVRRKDVVATLTNYLDNDDAEQVYEEVTSALRGESKVKLVMKI